MVYIKYCDTIERRDFFHPLTTVGGYTDAAIEKSHMSIGSRKKKQKNTHIYILPTAKSFVSFRLFVRLTFRRVPIKGRQNINIFFYINKGPG